MLESVLLALKELGWTPGAIIDIGVASGTGGLYTVWPGVPILLVEPAVDSLPYMRRIAKAFPNVHVYNVGASDRSGTIAGRRNPASINVVVGDFKTKWEPTEFPVMRCDDIIAEAGLKGPFLYKLDTDGHELPVIRGSLETLRQTEVFIVEVNVFHRARGLVTPEEIWSAMIEADFSFFGVAGVGHSKSGLCRTVDMMFIRNDSPLYEEAYRNSSKFKPPALVKKSMKATL